METVSVDNRDRILPLKVLFCWETQYITLTERRQNFTNSLASQMSIYLPKITGIAKGRSGFNAPGTFCLQSYGFPSVKRKKEKELFSGLVAVCDGFPSSLLNWAGRWHLCSFLCHRLCCIGAHRLQSTRRPIKSPFACPSFPNSISHSRLPVNCHTPQNTSWCCLRKVFLW